MLYEIINFSDPYTIECKDLALAAVACAILGEGQYAFSPVEKDADEVPLMLFGSPDGWFNEKFGSNAETVIGKVMSERRNELADCLDSCLIGKPADRHDCVAAMERMTAVERERFRAQRHDRRRSSMNDIGGRAYKWARHLRAKTESAQAGDKIDSEGAERIDQ